MKFNLIAAVMLVLSSSAFAAEDSANKPTPEMMNAWKEYSTPGEAHKMLAKFVGKWKYTSKSWMSAEDTKGSEDSGTANFKMILGGRFLQQEVKGKAMGMNFDGLGLIGFDNIKKTYDTLWTDSMGTGMMRGTGTFDETAQTLKDSGTFTCPMGKDKTLAYRSEWKIIDKDSSIMTMWGPDTNGKDHKMMELTYKRAK